MKCCEYGLRGASYNPKSFITLVPDNLGIAEDHVGGQGGVDVSAPVDILADGRVTDFRSLRFHRVGMHQMSLVLGSLL